LSSFSQLLEAQDGQNGGEGQPQQAQNQHSHQLRVVLDYLGERGRDLDELASGRRARLEQGVQLCQFQSEANQVR